MWLDTKYKALTAAYTFSHRCVTGEYLIGASISEVDTSLDGQYDNALIWVEDTQGLNQFQLCNGLLENGSLAGWGCIPLKSGWQVKGRLINPVAGNIGSFSVALDSRPRVNVGWNVRQTTQSDIPAGNLVVIPVNGAAAVLTQVLQPGSGFLYRIIAAVAYHDDPVARTMQWKITDGTNEVPLSTSPGVDANSPWSLTSAVVTQEAANLSLPSEWIISNKVYLTCTASALAAGKKLYLRALVQRMVG